MLKKLKYIFGAFLFVSCSMELQHENGSRVKFMIENIVPGEDEIEYLRAVTENYFS
jgi:hypothetical protein